MRSITQMLLTTRLVEFICISRNVPFASARTIYRRLNKLCDIGFIDRSRFLYTGEYAYHLTPLGVSLLRSYDEAADIPRRARKTPSIALQAHEFDVSRFWIKFFSDSSKLNIPIVQFWRDESFVHQFQNWKLIPDGSAILKIKGKHRLFFLELDRSTQSSGMNTSAQAVIRQKLMRYKHLAKLYRRHPELAHYAPHSMRVVFVCQSESRMQNLRHVARDLGMGSMVVFIDIHQLIEITDSSSANGWNFLSTNMFSTPMFAPPARSPPICLL